MSTLAVGLLTNCLAPLALERASLRVAATVLRVDSLFVPDHYVGFVPPSVWTCENAPAAKFLPSADAFFDPFVMMGMMAARYRRVRIGTGVTETFRREPATLAQAFVTLDHLTRGRAILGLGNGERENTEPYGIPFRRRVARLEEALAIIRLLWESRGEPVDFDGSFWRMRRARLATPLYKGRPPAIWLAAHAPRMLRLTGRFADGWCPTIMKMMAGEYREKLACIAAARAEAGGSLEGFEPAIAIPIALGKGRRAVLEGLVKVPVVGALSMLLPGAVWARHGLRHPLGEHFEGFPEFVPEAVTAEKIAAAQRLATPELLGDGVMAGNAGEVVGEVRALVAAGARHVLLWNLAPLATGPSVAGLVRLAVLIRHLRRIELPPLLLGNGSPAAAISAPGRRATCWPPPGRGHHRCRAPLALARPSERR